MVWNEILGSILMFIGTLFLFLGALGVLRMPDVYNRMQAGTKTTTLGALSSLLGVGIYHPPWIFKTLLIALFIFLTNPVSSHALARAAFNTGCKPVSKLEEENNKETDQCI